MAGVLLLCVIQNVINQIGTPSSHHQSVVAIQAHFFDRAHLGRGRDQ